MSGERLAVDLGGPNTLNFYGLPVRLCPVRGAQPTVP